MKPAEILQQLIRFDTTNPPGGERECIEWIKGLVEDAGLEITIKARDRDRPNLIARRRGRGDGPPLLLQGHVDVVAAADADSWSQPPFEGRIEDGWVWGRGALDMKGGVAMMLSALLDTEEPRSDVIFAAMSDEEAGSGDGAEFLVSEHPELFEGVRYALGEFGAYTHHLRGRRFYPIQVLEKQPCWMRVVVRGQGGHGSLPVRGGAMGRAGRILATLDRKRLPVHVTPVVRQMIETMASALPLPMGIGVRALLEPRLTDHVIDLAGEAARSLDPLLHNTVSPTIIHSGDKINVIPAEVTLELDGRLLPGQSPEDLAHELCELTGEELDIEVTRHDASPKEEADMGLFDVLAGALREQDPEGIPMPFLMPASTDGRFFARLGIQHYGFLPMRLPEDFNFLDTIHAVDERIPVDALEFGAAAFRHVLERAG